MLLDYEDLKIDKKYLQICLSHVRVNSKEKNLKYENKYVKKKDRINTPQSMKRKRDEDPVLVSPDLMDDEDETESDEPNVEDSKLDNIFFFKKG